MNKTQFLLSNALCLSKSLARITALRNGISARMAYYRKTFTSKKLYLATIAKCLWKPFVTTSCSFLRTRKSNPIVFLSSNCQRCYMYVQGTEEGYILHFQGTETVSSLIWNRCVYQIVQYHAPRRPYQQNWNKSAWMLDTVFILVKTYT